MFNIDSYTDRIFKISSPEEFSSLALQAFEYQRENCGVYREYLNAIDKLGESPRRIEEIPFLPITLFKSNKIVTEPTGGAMAGQSADYKLFTSSATTSMIPSRHYVKDLALYEKSFTKGFEHFYGPLKNYNLLALLPSYLEREGSSLVYMADKLIAEIKKEGGEGGFYLYNHKELLEKLLELAAHAQEATQTPGNLAVKKTILLGVSFALLDFAAYITADECFAKEQVKNGALSNLIIMETGGMKGRGKELSRNQLHSILRDAFHSPYIHSEYGMAELLSQAYLKSGEIFQSPPWMKVLVRDILNPFKISSSESAVNNSYSGIKGGVTIIDLANIHSCCFIETEDLGVLSPQQKTGSAIITGSEFSIIGRIARSELRGCNMLLE